MTGADRVITNADVIQVLEDAGHVLGEHGWTRGSYLDKTNGRVCALGALAIASGVMNHDGEWNAQVVEGEFTRLSVLNVVVEERVREVVGTAVSLFNDYTAQSQGDVQAAFRDAITRIKHREAEATK